MDRVYTQQSFIQFLKGEELWYLQLEIIMFREESKTNKDQYHMFSLLCGF